MRQNRRWLAGIVIVVIAIIVFVTTRGHDEPPAYVARDAAVAMQPRLAPPLGAAMHDDNTAPRAPESTGDEPPLVQPAMADTPPFPPGSQPLTEGTDPAVGVSEDDPVDEGGGGAHVVFGARADVVHPPDPIIIDAQLLDAHGNRMAIPRGRVYFRGERDTAAIGTGPSAPLVDSGKLKYVATYAPTGAPPANQFRTFVELAFDAPPPGTGERHYSTWVQYTPKPHAHLSKQFTEAVIDGSLVIGAGVEIGEPGRYKVIASLYGPDHATAICFAQSSIVLGAGTQSVPLVFFGKILHDKGLDGPYTLRFMMVFEEFPDRGTYWPGVTVDDAYTTKPYKAASFSADPYKPPASTEPEVTAQSPSQANTPPPMFSR